MTRIQQERFASREEYERQKYVFVLDKEKLGLNKDDVTKKLNETVKNYNSSSVTADVLKKYYGDYYFEYLVVNEKATDYLYKNAEIS